MKKILLLVILLSIPFAFAQVECPDGSLAETKERCVTSQDSDAAISSSGDLDQDGYGDVAATGEPEVSVEKIERTTQRPSLGDLDADGLDDGTSSEVEFRDEDSDGDGIGDATQDDSISVSQMSPVDFLVTGVKGSLDVSSLDCPEEKCQVEVSVENQEPVVASFSGDSDVSLKLEDESIDILSDSCSPQNGNVVCGKTEHFLIQDVRCADGVCTHSSGLKIVCNGSACPITVVNEKPTASVENCDDGSCPIRPVTDVDINGDALEGEKISLVGFGSFSVSKVASPIYTSETSEGVSPLYEPETALQITGGGAGRVSLSVLKDETCPDDKCSSVAVEVMNTHPVAVFFEPEFATQENVFSLEDEVVNLDIANSVCSQQENEIHCTNENDNVLVVAFDKESEVVCEVEDAGQIYAWGHRAMADDEGKVYSWGYSTTKDENNIYAWGNSRAVEKQATDGEGNVYCWGENKESLKTEVEFTSFSISKRSARTERFDVNVNGSSNQTTRDFDTIDNAPEEKERGVSKPDSKKALDGFIRSINDIKSSLERCESDVCRQVSVNADDRKILVTQAQQNSDNTTRYIKEVQSIVREDIASLERCETDICRDVLSQEKELLVAITDYLDVDDEVEDTTSSRAAEIAFITESRGETLSTVKRARPSEWSQEDKDEIGRYIQNRTNLTREDLALSIAYQNSDNQRVREVRYNEETQEVEIDHVEEVKLFGLFRVDAQAKTRISENGTQETEYPWWSLLASGKGGGDVNVEELELAVEKIERG